MKKIFLTFTLFSLTNNYDVNVFYFAILVFKEAEEIFVIIFQKQLLKYSKLNVIIN
jgi:hypothetical protein